MTEAEWLNWPWDTADLISDLEDDDGKASPRKLRLFAVACCRGVWHLLTDELTRSAVEASEAFADGQENSEAMLAIASAAEVALLVAEEGVLTLGDGNVRQIVSRERGLALDLVHLANFIAEAPFTHCYMAQDASDAVMGVVMHSAIPSPQWGTAEGDTEAQNAIAEQQPKHNHLLRDIFGNPFRPITINPAWRTSTVVALTQAAYDERILPSGHLDADRLAVLTDALEDAGCSDADLLEHLRSSGPHVRGCFAVDLLLGKE